MKITSFNCTIEVSKDENGYSNNYYVDVTDKGVSISHPYVKMTPEEVMFTTELIHDFVGMTKVYNARVDDFNRDMKLEEYTVVTPPIVETTGSDFDLDAKSTVSEEISPQQALEELAALKKACSPEGSNFAQTSEVSTVEAELKARETGSDMA